MDSLLWVHCGVIIVAVDVISGLVGLAIFVDRRLVERERRWGFIEAQIIR
jgi:hypothetical protein